MARVLLLSPPYLDLYGGLSRAAGRYFPLGLGYIASYLRRYGQHQVSMYEPEAQGLDPAAITALIRRSSPDVVGLTCSTPNFTRALELARTVKANSSAKVVLGGVHASALPDFILRRHGDLIDAIVVGEGEQTMLELVDAWAAGRGAAGIAGVATLRDGVPTVMAVRPYVADLDTLPYPARDLIPQHLFYPNLHNARHRSCVTILTSRGCPFNCSFCASRIVSGRRYRVHSAEYVLDEMTTLVRDHGARQLLITDDTFTIDRERLEAICRGMIDRRLGLEWFCFSQVNVVDRETLSMMKRAGCYNIGFGVESADMDTLRRLGKPIKPERAIETVRIANELKLKTQAFYILGFPNETRAQMQATVALAGQVNATLSFFNMLVPYPGTRDFAHFFKDTPLDEIPWDNFVAIGQECVLKNSIVSAREIEDLIARANLEYYAHPRRLVNLLSRIGTPYELANYARGGLSLAQQVRGWFRGAPA